MSEPRIFVSAGEASGDLHGAGVARALLDIYPGARLMGLAGPRMAAAGVNPVAEFQRLVVMGIAEVLAQLPFFIRLRREVRRLLDETHPDLVIPIDYPGFNLWLCEEAHRRRIPVLYYIAPQLWAWRPQRARVLAEKADRVAVVFPHEEPFLRDFGVDAVFVGHPLLDTLDTHESADEAQSALGMDSQRPVLGLLPGSRPQEVQRLLGPFIEAAEAVRKREPGVQVVVSGAPHVPRDHYSTAGDYPVVSDSGQVIRAATAVLTKSGTSTIESSLFATPMVIAHRVHPLTYALARRLVQVEDVGMVNILAGRRVVPEFVQRLPPSAIADALAPLLVEDSEERVQMIEALGAIRCLLGEPGAATRVARLAAELLEAKD